MQHTHDNTITRLRSFLSLTNGWLWGQGSIFKESDIDTLIKNYNNYIRPLAVVPFTYPQADNTVQFEWFKKDIISIIAYIELSVEKCYLLTMYDNEKINDTELNIDLTNESGWLQLKNEISSHIDSFDMK